MRKAMNCVVGLMLIATASGTAGRAAEPKMERFLFLGGSDPQTVNSKIDDSIDGIQIVYSWKSLEGKKDSYTFDKIERDVAFAQNMGKKLWVQLQDRSFSANNRVVPEYLLTEEIYHGGVAKQKDSPGEGAEVSQGWVAKQWNPHVRARYQKLMGELAKRFDGKIYGINLPETAADIDHDVESKSGFTCDKYFEATVENVNFARGAFVKSHVVQYVNFWPCEWNNDHTYMSRFFQNAVAKKIGLGGPDVIPYRTGQMKNAYPFFSRYKGDLPIVAFAVQEPTRTYTNPKTGNKFTDEEFLDFAANYLGARIIFWSFDDKK